MAAASSLGSTGADDDNNEDDSSTGPEIFCRRCNAALALEVRTQVDDLLYCISWRQEDRATAKRATSVLAGLAINEDVANVIVEGGAVPALVRHLVEPAALEAVHEQPLTFEHEVEKDAALALGILAVKPEHQQLIVDAGALPPLINLLKRHKNTPNSRVVNSVIKRAADAITNIAHENSNITTCVRVEGGIPPLVELLKSPDRKVQRASAGALGTLAFKKR